MLNMVEVRAPFERHINSFTEPFNSLITPYNSSDIRDFLRSFCQLHKNEPKLRIGKTIFLGDLGVGKTSIISRFREEIFDYDCKTTVGVDIHLEGFDILGLPFNLQIWDTAGQERFKCISSPYFRGTNVVVLVFDMSKENSLSHCEEWLDLALKEHSSHRQPYIVLVGNKMDSLSPAVLDGAQQIAFEVAKKLNAEYWAVSSKTGKNINKFFHRLAFLAFEHVILREINPSPDVRYQQNIKLRSTTQNENHQEKHKKCSC